MCDDDYDKIIFPRYSNIILINQSLLGDILFFLIFLLKFCKFSINFDNYDIFFNLNNVLYEYGNVYNKSLQ